MASKATLIFCATRPRRCTVARSMTRWKPTTQPLHGGRRSTVRSAQECAQHARKFIQAANREQDPEVKRRLLRLARANKSLAKLADLREKRSKT